MNIKEINFRLNEVKNALGLKQSEFGLKIGIAESNISQIINGKMDINAETIKALRDKLNVSSEWLLTGQGSMFLDSNELQIKNEPWIPFYDIVVSAGSDEYDLKEMESMLRNMFVFR